MWHAVRKPIEFERTIAGLEKRGPFDYVDAGPAGTLATFLKYTLPSASASRMYSILSPFGMEPKNYHRLILERGPSANSFADPSRRGLHG
ncbi:MAG: bacillaene synthase trans-acting acyltransferase [Bradyrhizobium sp.]|jgi:hypothetical protein|nr:bacillaene synthase trans-acting acyltransferase [Bradyrhizobium sp.]